MSKITVYLPDQSLGILNVADGVLVYDGTNFVEPDVAKYVGLYDVPVSALTLEYKNLIDALLVSQQVKAEVKEYDPQIVPTSDPDIIVAPNPSPTCVCFITCSGTRIAYVKVIKEP